MSMLIRRIRFDWALFAPAIVLSLIGILTISAFGQDESLAQRQMLWLFIAASVYVVLSNLDMRFIRRTSAAITMYTTAVILLVLLLLVADPIMGARAWFSFGFISFQPADFAKLAMIVLLAKYLSRRHVEIGDIRHILVSGVYALALIIPILVQPDMGNTIIFSTIWLSLLFVSGISKKHLALIGITALIAGSIMWFEGLKPYQRARIVSFINPAADIRGIGYSAHQSKIAIGSGEIFGKGIGHGTQSELHFLPEYHTDFIFAAFAEEWGFVGVTLLLALYGFLFARLIQIARTAVTNFDAFFTLGALILFVAHLSIHTGINLGLLPVTGTTIPFMSYGGSHLLLGFAILGIVTSFARYKHVRAHNISDKEYPGSQ